MKNVQSSTPAVPTGNLVFYCIGHASPNKMRFQKIWDSYVVKRNDDVSCTNIFNYPSLTPEMLADSLRDKTSRLEFLPLIKEEHQKVADYVFVCGDRGRPLAGFHLKQFIDSCEA